MSQRIMIKTPADIEKMQAAGHIVEQILIALKACVRPGVRTIELDEAAVKIIKGYGAKASFLNYRGFPFSICASVNEQVVHGFPGKTKLREGDIISVDVGVELNGWHADAARTYFVGEVSPEVAALVRVTRECFFEGAKHAVVGNHLHDISSAVQQHAQEHGYGVVRELVGHGIGRHLHEPPDVPNYRLKGQGRGIRLQEGMVIAVEPMINMGKRDVRLLQDQWTVVAADGLPSAHYENTIAITEQGPRFLTLTLPEEGPEVETV